MICKQSFLHIYFSPGTLALTSPLLFAMRLWSRSGNCKQRPTSRRSPQASFPASFVNVAAFFDPTTVCHARPKRLRRLGPVLAWRSRRDTNGCHADPTSQSARPGNHKGDVVNARSSVDPQTNHAFEPISTRIFICFYCADGVFVSQADFFKALRNVRSSVSAADIVEHEKWAKEFGMEGN